MRSLLFILVAAIAVIPSGCAAIAEAVIDSIIESDDDDSIDPDVLERKGIEPGSDRHKRLEAEVEFHGRG